MILRGAMGKKLPFGRVRTGDKLYFINNNGEGLIKAVGTVNNISQSENISKEESQRLVDSNMDKLLIGDNMYKRFAGKRNIILIDVSSVREIVPIKFNKEKFGNMDDWIPFNNLDDIK